MTSLWRHSRLTCYDLGPNFWHKVSNCWPERYGKFQSEIPSTSGAICEKPQGALCPPPAGRGLNHIWCLVATFSWQTESWRVLKWLSLICIKSCRMQWRCHGGGANMANLRSDTPWDRCRSEEIFISEKMGEGLQDLVPRFTWTDATADVLWSFDYEKEGVLKVVEGVTLVGPQWCCGALWDLSVLVLALPSMTFFMWIWAPPKK